MPEKSHNGIVLNGEVRQVPVGWTVQDLLADLGLEEGQVAVEINREIVRRSSWPQRRFEDGDAVEVVHFVGGG